MIHVLVLVSGALLAVIGLILMSIGEENYGRLDRAPPKIVVGGFTYLIEDLRYA